MKVTVLTMLAAAIFSCSKPEPAKENIKNDNSFSPSIVSRALDNQEKKLIDFFYSGADQKSGCAYNSSNYVGSVATGATGFGIMGLIAGVERGWIPRTDAVEHILKIEKFLDGATRFNGAWAHWHNPQTGENVQFGNQAQAPDIVESSFMIYGLLAAYEYFDSNDPSEAELRRYVDKFWNEIDWSKNVYNGKFYWIHHYDKTGSSAYENPITGWNEALITYILALAAPDGHNIAPSVYRSCWLRDGSISHPDQKIYGYKQPLGNPSTKYGLFLGQYSFLGLDPRHLSDAYANYWDQVMGYTMINRHYCVYLAPESYKYSEEAWGITACASCGSTKDKGYVARTTVNDDGVLCPSACISSYPFTPFYCTQVLLNLNNTYADGKYGFKAAIMPSTNSAAMNYLSMEHSPMPAMIENYRSGLIWKLIMRNEHIQEGLRLAGFHEPDYNEGFYLAVPDTKTGNYDMMRHPDREKYEIDFFAKQAGKASFIITSKEGTVVYKETIELESGANLISFFDNSIPRGKEYRIRITPASGKMYSISVTLR